MNHHRAAASWLASALAAALAAGCVADPASTPAGSTAAATPPLVAPSDLVASTAATPSSTVGAADPPVASPLGAVPPAAALAAEGGDPVEAQLGTYTWGDAGSDAPWLPGAPIVVGAGEPLTVTFDPPLAPDAWRALLAEPDAGHPADALTLDTGAGIPAFRAPSTGRYTLALTVTVEGQGTAHYAWLLDVR